MQNCIQSFISKENAGKASVGVAALPGASACTHLQERREQRCSERVTDIMSVTIRYEQAGQRGLQEAWHTA